MDKVKFNKDQICSDKIIHKANKEYECISEDSEHFYIRQENCPKGENWCTEYPKNCEGKLFEFVK